MGRSNISVEYPEECVFFVDYDLLTVGEDENENNWYMQDQLDLFVEAFKAKFPAFDQPSKANDYVRANSDWCRVLLENELFRVTIQDNEWSVAISLVGRDDSYYMNTKGLRRCHAVTYRLGLVDALLQIFDEIGFYGGPYGSGRLSHESWSTMSPEDKKDIPTGYIRSRRRVYLV